MHQLCGDVDIQTLEVNSYCKTTRTVTSAKFACALNIYKGASNMDDVSPYSIGMSGNFSLKADNTFFLLSGKVASASLACGSDSGIK